MPRLTYSFSTSMRWTVGIVLALQIQAYGCAPPVLAGAPLSPESVLVRQFGLSRRAKAEVWVTPRERDVALRLEQLPNLVNQVRTLSTEVAEARKRNLVAWLQRQALEKALRKTASKLSPGDPERKEMEESLKKLDLLAVAPDKLGGAPAMQSRLIDMTIARNSILLGAAAVREDIAMLASEYTALRNNQAVIDALERLGANHRLGPLRQYANDLSSLNEFEQFVYEQPTPLYLESGRVRVGAILNEESPITFTWRSGAEPTVIPCSTAQNAGIQPPADAPLVPLRFERGRRLPSRRIVLASIRFGRHVLRDVEAYVLPPEGEDLGAQIGRSAFAGFQVTPELVHLHFRIEPQK